MEEIEEEEEVEVVSGVEIEEVTEVEEEISVEIEVEEEVVSTMEEAVEVDLINNNKVPILVGAIKDLWEMGILLRVVEVDFLMVTKEEEEEVMIRVKELDIKNYYFETIFL